MAETDRWVVAWGLARELTRARTEGQVAGLIARAAAVLTDAQAVRVWMIDRGKGYRFSGSWPAAEEAPGKPPDDLPRAVVFGAPLAGRAEDPFRSRLVIPLQPGARPLGGIELLESRRPAGPFSTADAGSLSDLVATADLALEALRENMVKERAYVAAIARLTRLYDIGRSLTSTLEMDPLVQAVVSRVQAALEAGSAYLWLYGDGKERLSVVAAVGRPAAAVTGWELGPGEGVAGHVASTGESVLFDDPDEIPSKEDRPDVQAGLEIQSVAAVPVTAEDGSVLGVIEVVLMGDDVHLEQADLPFLRQIAETTALALGNARRLDAERRASDLGALLATAQELGASLDTQRVAFTLVHQSASFLGFRRAAVGLYKGGRLELVAVSGQTFVDEKLPEMKALGELLVWAAQIPSGLYIVQEEDGTIDADRPETREKFQAFFEKTGSRSFLTIPLEDDEGRLGVFALEAAAPYAFSQRELEAASLLAVQATIAVRNATLYQQIPMVRVLRPFALRKQRLLALSRTRLAGWSAAGLLAAVVLFVIPVPLRIGAEARVLPERRVPVTAEVEGRVAQVLVREGDPVQPGQVIALLHDADYRAGLGDAAARYEVARVEQSRLRADGQPAGAAVEAARLGGVAAEVALWRERLEQTRIRSSAAGVVATPRIEETVGARVAKGDVFCEVVDPARQRIELAVSEPDAGLLATGMPVKVKLHAFSSRSLRAQVEQVGVAAAVVDGNRVFLARARIEPPAPPLRSGMTGRAKIDTGRASVARLLLRRPARWIWSVVWGWLP